MKHPDSSARKKLPALFPVISLIAFATFAGSALTGCDKAAEEPDAAEPAASAADAPADPTPEPEASPSPEPEASPEPAATPATPATPAAPSTPAADATPEAAAIDLPDPVATVNGEPISLARLQEAFEGALGSAGVDASMLTEDQKLAGYSQLLEDLIVDQLIQAQAAGVEVSAEEVASEIAAIKGQFPSEEIFAEQLAQSGQTEEGLADLIKEGMKQRKWIESQLGDDAKVGEDDAKDFYDSNPDEFEQPETVRASHILFMVPDDADEATAKAKEEAARAAMERAKGGEDFEALAKELSEEPGASETGGDLDFFTKDRMVPEFAEASFGMAVGEISEPVKTQFGWHVIKVTDKREAGKIPFDEVKPQLEAFLQTRKQQEAVTSVIEKLRGEADVQIHLPTPESPDAGGEPDAAGGPGEGEGN